MRSLRRNPEHLAGGLEIAARANSEIQGLGPLLSRARSIEVSVFPGSFGKRRRGVGYDFWQFRQAEPGEPARLIDWRQSAKSDLRFVRDREHQSANTALFWADNSASMKFSGTENRRSKADRARLLALAAAMWLARSDERVGVLGDAPSPPTGSRQIEQIAASLFGSGGADYGAPPAGRIPRGAFVTLLSDFLGPWPAIESAVRQFSGQEARGALIQILDPFEAQFPFAGRTRFKSPGGTVEFETLQAGAVRDGYGARLRERQAGLAALADKFGWFSLVHDSSGAAAPVLMWLSQILQAEI